VTEFVLERAQNSSPEFGFKEEKRVPPDITDVDFCEGEELFVEVSFLNLQHTCF